MNRGWVGILEQSMGTMNRAEIGLSNKPAWLHWLKFKNTVSVNLLNTAEHRYRGQCHWHRHSGILYLSPVRALVPGLTQTAGQSGKPAFIKHKKGDKG
jgi:hypothetical protein